MTTYASHRDVFDISGRVVVVSGGLGQLGRQFCAELLRRGARVAVLDLPESIDQNGISGEFYYRRADVTSRDSLKDALKAICNHWETPYAIINNAALDSPPGADASENGPFEDYPVDSWDKVMAVNLKGVFLACQVFGGAMAEAGRGSIVNICSTYGLVSPDQRIYEYRQIRDGRPFFKPAAYSASKSALVNLTRYVATYFASRGVRANLITPGGVFNHQDQEFLAGYCARVPLGRMAREDEYNGAIVFLVSDASSYMTGANLVMDGGWTAW